MSADRSRDWCFTLNNYTDFQYETICNYGQLPNCVYLVVGKEVGKSGTPHLQGYIYYKNARSFDSVRKLLFDAHIEKAKGTSKQASDYCKKQKDYIELGTLPKQGKRNDIEEIKEIVKSGGSIRDVVEVATSYQSFRMAEVYFKYMEKPRTWKPKVEWYYGPTGTGKTKLAYEVLGDDAYTAMSTGKWWEGYDAHENVLIDDMRKDFLKFHELLRLLDRYAMKIETKGGSRQFLAKHIIITSAYHPTALYDTREDIQQLLRRIDVIREFTNEDEYI